MAAGILHSASLFHLFDLCDERHRSTYWRYTSSHVLSISRTNTTTTTSTHNLGTQFIFFDKRQEYYSVPVAWREMHLCFLVYLLELIHGRWGNHTITPLQCRHNERDSVSNHQPHDCLLNRTFRRRSKKHQSSASLVFVRRIHRGPMNSPHKWPVTRKMFPFDDVTMPTPVKQSRRILISD